MKAWYMNTKYTADFMATRPFMAFIHCKCHDFEKQRRNAEGSEMKTEHTPCHLIRMKADIIEILDFVGSSKQNVWKCDGANG